MSKKGKELDLGGLRVQVDPFILLRRVLMRQKLFLFIVAVIGGAATIWSYKTTPKVYTSRSTIAIRNENVQEDVLRNLINRAMRDLNADGEMMLIINELDLFSSLRASTPYDQSLRRMSRELKVDRQQGVITVVFESKSPKEAQQVVAFATERVLHALANLQDSPYRRTIEGLETNLQELLPRWEIARTKVFEFKARHPEIAVTNPDFIPQDSPLAGIQTQIAAAETNLRRCYAGAAPVPTQTPKRPDGPACNRLRDLQRRHQELLAQYTPQHPEVRRALEDAEKQEAACDREAGAGASIGEGPKPGMSQAECVAAAERRIKDLIEQKVGVERQAIKKPELQKQWQELSLELNQTESELRNLRERRSKTISDRVLAANDFQELFKLVDAARVPELPSKPERNSFLAVGILLTAILGLIVALVREALRQSFLDAKEFEEQTGLTVMAVLPDIGE